MIEILTNTYVLPLIAVIIGLVILWLYDKFENKQYRLSQYTRIAILIYISSFALIFVMRHSMFTGITGVAIPGIQSGGGQVSNGGTQSKNNYDADIDMPGYGEHFNTGLPTF